MEDRLSELMAKLDKMRDAQVKLQDKLSKVRRTPGDEASQEGGGHGEVDGEEAAGASGNTEEAAGQSDQTSSARSPTSASTTVNAISSEPATDGKASDGLYAVDPYDTYSLKREALLVSAENGDLVSLRETVGEWADDDYLMNECLYLAASRDHLQCAKVLVENSANCSYWHSPADETVLSVSTANGHLDMMQFLVRKGVNVNQAVSGDKHTALHSAAMSGKTDCARFIIDNGADLNSRDTFGITPLMSACKEGHVDIVDLLLNAKADTELKSRVKKETAFEIAFQANHANCVQALAVAYPSLATKEFKGGLLPLHHAIRHGQNEVVCALIDAGIDINLSDGPWSPIHLAVEMSNIPIIGILAACGAKLNNHLPIPKKVTILMLAVCKENPEMVKAIGSQGSCNLNQFDEIGRTALYLAAKFGFEHCVEVLLELCGDVDAYASHMVQEWEAAGKKGQLPAPTALHAAILNDHPKVAALLIAAECKKDLGAIFEEDNISNVFTPLHVACLRKLKWAVDMLLEARTPVPDGFTDWCRKNGIDSALIDSIEAEVMRQKKNPGLLQQVCRTCIRNALGSINMYPKVKGLDVPFAIRDYLLYKDLNVFVGS